MIVLDDADERLTVKFKDLVPDWPSAMLVDDVEMVGRMTTGGAFVELNKIGFLR